MTAHLHAVQFDPNTGEVLPQCSQCREKDDEIKGLQTNLRGWMRKYAELARDKDREALEHELYPVGERWHSYWRERCNHPRCDYGPDEFWLIFPFLKSKTYEPLIGRAIDGAAYDPVTRTRRNGSVERFDGFDLIFRSRSKFQSFVNRAPRGTR